ncbi:MAG: hypothetical protein BIFFINMI_01717 [Phycisphaerae bacterium]|nr:hypothetical protein [Phycisphaerae bacterium]
MFKRTTLTFLVCLLTLGAGWAHADVYTWGLSGSGAWATGTNWTPTGPPTSADTAVFDDSTGAGRTITLATNTIATVNVTGSYGWTFSGSGSSLTFGTLFSYASSGQSSISSRLRGTGQLSVTAGRLDLNNSTNDFSGGLLIDGGQVRVSGATSGTPLGAGLLRLKSGSLSGQGSQNYSIISNTFQIEGNFTFGGMVETITNQFTGTGTLLGSYNLTVPTGAGVQFNSTAVIGDGGNGYGFAKLGGGTLTTSALNTFTGQVAIKEGVLGFTGGSATVGSASPLGKNSTILLGDAVLGADASLLKGNGAGTLWQNITVVAGAGTRTIGTSGQSNGTYAGNITLNKNVTINTFSGDNATFSGQITGVGGITKTGTATATFSGDNSFQGAADLTAGTTILSTSANALSTNALGGTVTVQSGAILRYQVDISRNITLNGGTLIPGDAGNNMYNNSGNLTVTAPSTLGGSGDGTRWRAVSGLVSGGSLLTVNNTSHASTLLFTHVDNSHSGGLLIINGSLGAGAAGSLGTGPVQVGDATGVGALRFYEDLPAANNRPSSIVVNANSEVSMNTTAAVTMPITLNGGSFWGGTRGGGVRTAGGMTAGTTHGLNIYSGALTLAADSFVGVSGDGSDKLTLNGQIVDDTPAHDFKVTYYSGSTTQGIWLGSANSYGGGTEINGALVVTAATGGLSSGPVVVSRMGPGAYPGNYTSIVQNRGILRTTVDGSLTSASSVSFTADSLYDIRSIESKVVSLGYGAAITRGAGSAPIVYSGAGQNVALSRGAIIDPSAPEPTRTEVAALGGTGSDFGLFRGRTVAESGTWSFGNDGSSTLYRGLAATTVDFTFTGTANDVASGTPGVSFYSQAARTLTIGTTGAGAAINSSKLILDGAGSFVFAGSLNTLPGTIQQNGVWMVRFNDAGGLASGKTLNVNGGWLDLNHAGALAAGSAVNVNNGGIFYLDQTLTSGTVAVNNGGGLYLTGDQSQLGAAAWTFAAGSQIFLGVNLTAALPGSTVGNSDIVLRSSSTVSLSSAGLALSESTRLTVAPTSIGGAQTATLSTGNLSLVGGQTFGRLTALTGGSLVVSTVVNFTGGKLIVGDVNDFRVISQMSTPVYYMAGQAGLVQLSSTSNQMAAIEIQKGTLRVDALAHLGGATDINLVAGGTLRLDYNTPAWTGALHGTGTVLIGDAASGTSTLTLNTGTTVSPGNSAGVMDFTGNLAFGAGTSTLNIEVLGGGAVAGTDYDALHVTGTLTGLSNVDLVITFDTGLFDVDLLGDTLTIATTSSDLSGLLTGTTGFKSVTIVTPGYSADLNYNNGSITLTNLTGPEQPVPEPATLGLLALGGVGLIAGASRRRRI